MIFELFKDIAKLALIVASLDLALRAYVRCRLPAWCEPLQRRRVVILSALVLAATAIKVSEDVLGKESGPVDEAILWAIRNHIPATLTGFFEAVTVTGSSIVLIPLASAATIALVLAKRRIEALQFAASAITAPILVYVIKTAVGRARPALWESRWYWGSSFPSGHTLAVAAISTAAALCVGWLWPKLRGVALSVAFAWTLLMALSRMVLGVHWPTDVLTAACIGAFIPLAISLAFELHQAKRA
jgi:undecaprenyl-diphosphatase